MIFRTLLPVMALLLPGCVARTAWDVATAPVRAGSQAADWATTSQDEADRNRGREMRKEEERRRKQCRKQHRKDC